MAVRAQVLSGLDQERTVRCLVRKDLEPRVIARIRPIGGRDAKLLRRQRRPQTPLILVALLTQRGVTRLLDSARERHQVASITPTHRPHRRGAAGDESRNIVIYEGRRRRGEGVDRMVMDARVVGDAP